MAIAVDTSDKTTNVTNQIAGGTTTLSFTTGSGSGRALIVSICTWNNGGTGTGCSTVTFGAQNMTLVSGSGQANTDFYVEQWRLVAPTSGTGNIVATVSSKTDKLGLMAVSFTGVDQTTPVDVKATAVGTSGTVTASLTTTANSEYMVDAVSHLSANTATSGTGTVVLNDGAVGAGMASQYGVAPTAGTNALSWTYPDPGDKWAYSTLALKPSGSATTSISTNMLMGV